MFLKELELYIDQFKAKFEDISLETVVDEGKKQLVEFGSNLLEGISYYMELSEKLAKEKKEVFILTLESLKLEVLAINKKIEIL